MNESDEQASPPPLNWTAIAALYAALALGLVWMLYWGDYRNATWLVLLGTGGGLTAYGRVEARRGRSGRAKWLNRAAALAYIVFFVWAGAVLVRAWIMR